jgi:hypothetical protein
MARIRVQERTETVLGSASAKTVTSLLPQPSVLWARPFLSVSLPEGCQGIKILFYYFLILTQMFYCIGAREKNFKVHSMSRGVSSFAIFGRRVCLCELQMCLHLRYNYLTILSARAINESGICKLCFSAIFRLIINSGFGETTIGICDGLRRSAIILCTISAFANPKL